ncbi:hypothetical protein P154DRAFT_425601 [Amniculicola lignicola CBS 123094]|uniref:Uncharacterized protein n=1 Tax=Amniculicola lignicola CBS 123094 TaxID=1392246 RepID=A0A6A5X265_9PLEO|nr:hypothetical protein P154DRAFT_425601 [Amniculicola lignicola CBS 123094]
MLLPRLLVASAAIAARISAAPVDPPQDSSEEPCAKVAGYVKDSKSDEIPAQVAHDCLKSVPVDKEGDEKLIDQLKTAWQWQSDLGYLKNAPDDWELGKLDADADLDKIKEKLSEYESEYDVQLAIQDITIKSGNFHWTWTPDILQVFAFERAVGIASISEDGKSPPKIYTSVDASKLAKGDKEGVSEIEQVNGEDVHLFLQKVASFNTFQDCDGRMNEVFYHGDTSSRGSFRQQKRFDGGSTELKFANGKIDKQDNTAATSQDWAGVKDGKSFFDTFCKGDLAKFANLDDFEKMGDTKPVPGGGNATRRGLSPYSVSSRAGPSDSLMKRAKLPGTYGSKAIVYENSGSLAGYFLEGDGYDNVAVLKIINFSPNDATGVEYQEALTEFLAKCVEGKKDKLIIDLRENTGGFTHLYMETFMQLFPGKVPYSAQNYRLTKPFEAIGGVADQIHSEEELKKEFEKLLPIHFDRDYRFWAFWRFKEAKNYDDWKSWDDFDGPMEVNGDKFTSPMRYDYSNKDFISIQRSETFAFSETEGEPPFKPENIVMLTDGLCGSSCACLHEDLKNLAGIKAIAIGGTTKEEPMQAVMGSKGGEVVPVYVSYTTSMVMTTAARNLKIKDAKNLEKALEGDKSIAHLLTRAGEDSTRIQMQNQLRAGDDSGTPLQYIYEAADCKIFYTAETYKFPDKAWKSVWDAFKDDFKDRCVKGSTGHKSSISGGFKPHGWVKGQLEKGGDKQGDESDK